MRIRSVAVLLGLLFLFPGVVRSQAAWDSPLLVPPRAPAGFGAFVFEPEDGDLGVLGTLRQEGWPNRLQLRLGVAGEEFGDGAVVLGGLDISGMMVRASQEFPLDVAWVAGAGIGVDGGARLSFPAGLIAGRTFPADDAAFTPYASPRIVVDALFDGPNDGLDLDIAVDLGLDIAVQPEWTIRFGGTVGDRDALAIGVVF